MATQLDNGSLGLWQVIKPSGTTDTNYVTNPSFEINTTGWTATNATLTRTANAGLFGGFGGRMLASATNGNIAITSPSVSGSPPGACSAYVKASSSLVTLKIDWGGGNNISFAHPGDGQWHRLGLSTAAVPTGTATISVIDGRSSAWTNVDIDGVQYEYGTGVVVASTYFDGDQYACQWSGAVHNSISLRDGRDARGGQFVSFTSLGLYIVDMGGIGVPDMTIGTDSRALSDGANYTGSVAKERVITMAARIFGTGTPANLHSQRATVFNPMNPDSRSVRGLISLRYAGSSTPKYISGYCETGFGWEEINGATDKLPLRFLVADPIWVRETEQSATLTINQTLSPVQTLALRNGDGTWSTLGGGPAVQVVNRAYCVEDLFDGRLLVGGSGLLDFGGTAANDNLCVWDGSTWGLLGSTAPNGAPLCSAVGNTGVLYVSGVPGTMTTINGVTVNGIGQYNGTWAIVGTGGLTGTSGFLTMIVDPATGYLWAAGDGSTPYPVTAGGVTINGLGLWNGSAWSAISQTGLPANWAIAGPQSMVVGPDGRIYMGILSPTTKGIYVWGGSSWSLYAASTGTSNGIFCLLSARGRLYVGGYFTGIGGVAVSHVAELTGTGISSMGGGIVDSGGFGVRSLGATTDGLVYAGGRGLASVGGVPLLDSLAAWDGATWRPFTVDAPNTSTHANDTYHVRSTRSGRLLLNWASTTGTFGTSMTADAITNVTNNGSANAYPIIAFTGAGSFYSIANLTTGKQIFFSGLTLTAGEIATLDLRPKRKTFTTPLRNLMQMILPSSNLSAFCLAPGVNRLAVYASAGSASIHWTPRDWAGD